MTARIGFKIPTGAKGARLTAPISIPSNNSSQDSNRSYAKRRRALLSSFGEQSPLFSKGFPKKNAKLISQTRATPNLIEKCSRRNSYAHHARPAYGGTPDADRARRPTGWRVENDPNAVSDQSVRRVLDSSFLRFRAHGGLRVKYFKSGGD